jgi:hypothetical protein
MPESDEYLMQSKHRIVHSLPCSRYKFPRAEPLRPRVATHLNTDTELEELFRADLSRTGVRRRFGDCRLIQSVREILHERAVLAGTVD